MKKIISTALLLSFAALELAPCCPAFAQTSTAAPKQFKSMIKKNKKTNDSYKYDLIVRFCRQYVCRTFFYLADCEK